MSLPAEQLHQQSLHILAKLATCNQSENGKNVENVKRESSKMWINQNVLGTKRCPYCTQVECDGNCDKENISKSCTEREKGLLTPQKCPSSSEPITPTANLKMLVSAATDLQPSVNVKTTTTIQEIEMDGDVHVDMDAEDNDDLASQKVKLKKGELMGRKEKSLGLLCKKFMSLYPEFSPLGTTIMLDDVVKSLSIGRRRVYDIVNVLESMEMMVRQAKNKYTWFGKSRLPATLSKLKALALRVYGKNFSLILKRFCHIQPKPKESMKKNCFILPKDSQNPSAPSEDALSILNDSENDPVQEYEQPKVDDLTRSIMDSILSYDHAKRDSNRSLGILCQKFIMLFMVAEDSTVSLDRAAKLLITEPGEGLGKYKTKVRRLYDIANILTSINFLEKCVSYEDATKKAAYRWIGLDLKTINCEESASRAFLSQEFSLTRHSLLTQAPIERCKLVNESEKSKLRKLQFRSASAHQLNVNQLTSIDESEVAKQIRTFTLRTLSDTMVNNERNIQLQTCDGFDIENVEEVVDLTTTESNPGAVGREDSPNQVLFKQKLRSLQREFPSKLPGNGLLDLLATCSKDYASNVPNGKVPVPSRRRLSSDFDSQTKGPQQKKVKMEDEENINPIVLAETLSRLGGNLITNTITPLFDQNNGNDAKRKSNDNVDKIEDNFSNGMLVDGNKVLISSENIMQSGEKGNMWQQPTYFTMPATLKPVAKAGSSAQNITTMLVSPLANPLSIPKSGLYQIIPVQCHPVLEQNESKVSSPTHPTLMAKSMRSNCDGGKVTEKSPVPIMMRPCRPAGERNDSNISSSPQSTLKAKTIRSNCDGVKVTDKSPVPILMRPPSVGNSPTVAISPTPTALKNFTDSPVNYPRLNGNYEEFVTPPHVLHRTFGKPPANPIVFPKMTPETPSSNGQISQTILTNVTRKLMLLQRDDN